MKKIFYAQSGGPTAVINATLAAVIESAHQQGIEVLIGIYGIHGLLEKNMVSSLSLSQEDLKKIARSPGGSFGSCRYQIQERHIEKILDILEEEKIDGFLYQGGNDSQLSLLRIAEGLKAKKSSCCVIGLPKTIDNDLVSCDLAPGFASAGLFLARSLRQLCLDLSSMCRDSTKIYIVECMGRHSGWLTAAASLAHDQNFPGPQIMLVPERKISLEEILERSQQYIEQDGYCAIVISENYWESQSETSCFRDDFGHRFLEGSGWSLKQHLSHHLKVKSRLALPDYFQRSAAYSVSEQDREISEALGSAAIVALLESQHGVMLTVLQDRKRWRLSSVPLSEVGGKERHLPLEYLDPILPQLSESGRNYMRWALGPCWSAVQEEFWPHYTHQSWSKRLTVGGTKRSMVQSKEEPFKV